MSECPIGLVKCKYPKSCFKLCSSCSKKQRHDELAYMISENEIKAYLQGKSNGAREFSEWLQENVIIDAENGVTVVAEVEYTRVISFIELLEMYEKEQKR